ncbi:MAG: glycerophosphodiester phosphodiesterase family protein [Pseudomonadota bacterium]
MSDLSWLTAMPVAHRGLHDSEDGRIENSLSSVRAALDQGFAIEVDLQLAGDAVPVVFHDTRLDRLTDNAGPVAERTARDLARIRLTGSDDTIPSLTDLLDLVDGASPLFLELKPHGPRNEALAQSVSDVLRTYPGPAALMSFDPDLVATIGRLMPDATKGIVADATQEPVLWGGLTTMERFGLRHLLHMPRTRPDFIAYDCRALPAPGPFLWRLLRGMPILTWTVRSALERDRVARWSNQIIFEGFDPHAR